MHVRVNRHCRSTCQSGLLASSEQQDSKRSQWAKFKSAATGMAAGNQDKLAQGSRMKCVDFHVFWIFTLIPNLSFAIHSHNLTMQLAPDRVVTYDSTARQGLSPPTRFSRASAPPAKRTQSRACKLGCRCLLEMGGVDMVWEKCSRRSARWWTSARW